MSGDSRIDLPIRPELREVSPYGAPQLDVPVRLNTNENPHPPSEAVQAAISAAVRSSLVGIERYPDRDAVELRTALAGYLSRSTGVSIDYTRVWAANGSNEVLQQLLQLFGGPNQPALGFGPTYSMHAIIARGTYTEYLNIARGDAFEIDVSAAAEEIARIDPAVVFVCSPNNPTGTATTLETIASLYEVVVQSSRGVLIVDEAYAEFSANPSAITLLGDRPRLIITRTMSKAFAFAGGRVGYLAASPEVVEGLQLVRLPYHLSAITQAAAVAALTHEAELAQAVADLRAQRDRMARELGALGYQVAPSDANFVLFRTNGDQGQMWRQLLAAGVLVRDVGLPGWLRVTAGTTDQTSAFLAAMKELTPSQP